MKSVRYGMIGGGQGAFDGGAHRTAAAIAGGSVYLERLGEDRFGILYDTFHANIEEKDPIAAFHTAWAKGHVNHVHISENDRGTPGKGHAKIRETISALKGVGYDGWMTIEAFGKALLEMAAATRVWRDFFCDPKAVYTDGYRYIKECWEG